MSSKTEIISCPNCGHEIDVNELLSKQITNELEKEFREKVNEEKNKYEAQREKLAKEKSAFEKDKKKQDEVIDAKVNDKLKQQEKQLASKLRKQITNEQKGAIQELQNELEEKSNQLGEFNKLKSKLARTEREKDELKDTLEAEAEKKITEEVKKAKQGIRKQVEDELELKLADKETVIQELRKNLTEAKRKAEQGSMQLQGEVQELAIEEWLMESFPLDSIEEIKKGARGGDCLQIVNTRSRQNCGTIYYESKRTKAFQPQWVEKFKNDMRTKAANVGVIVTEAMPSNMERMGLLEGVWICTYEEFKSLCVALREGIISVNKAIVTQENKGDKMGMLYDFLTSNEFRLQIEAIVEGFTQMKIDLESEKRSMNSIWKKREKQIEKVILNTGDMYGSIKGIAGKSIQSVPMLELPSGDDDSDE